MVTIVRDMGYPYEENYPLIQSMGIVSLGTWEMARAAITASEEFAKIVITELPVSPILNNAYPEWVSLYVGRKGFKGPTSPIVRCFLMLPIARTSILKVFMTNMRTQSTFQGMVFWAWNQYN